MAFPGSLLFEKEPKKTLALNYIFPRYTDAFMDHKGSYKHCSITPWTDCVITCRRSPRLLTNGYYTFTEDSFLSDEDGNITLSPSQTSITYKEKSVKIFRRRKRLRRSLVGLFNISVSNSWLNGTVCNDSLEQPNDKDAWLEGDSKVDASQHYDNVEEYFHEKSLESSKTLLMKNDLCQMVMLSVCLIISLFARFFLGGFLTTLLSSLLLIILICDILWIF